ncbi:hypothetical protein PNOK_0119800 [Pyrrhoderma noxium]|uniref:Uncharacterized protein n=1 Tax=Pyrrhoderma noxium TaxID=2282107 RepID=A0A286UX13_9AGAM|nr:hypothetical protein PNOK_0119800 [Pyrrhoderma noxium]
MARFTFLSVFPLALLAMLSVASAATLETSDNCLGSGEGCVVDPPSTGDVTIQPIFCSACCNGFTPSLVGSSGVCN